MAEQSRPGMTSVFDFHVQILECKNCGAPIKCPLSGGQISCEHCDAVHVVNVREAGAAPAPARPAAEDRIAWLRSQFADPNRVNPYDPDANYLQDLLQHKGRSLSPAQYEREVLPEFRSAWNAATGKVRAGNADDETRYRVYWLADKLAYGYEFLAAATARGQGAEVKDAALHRRAVLETAQVLLADTEYAYVLRCELTRAAAREGDVAAAQGWLGGCDPEPASADLDTEYRLARASLCAAEGDGQGILDLLGVDLEAVPLSGERNGRLGAALRVHAYELLGQDNRALTEYHAGEVRFGHRQMWSELQIGHFAPKFTERRKRMAKRVRLGCAIFLLAVIVGVVLLLTR
jgi:hypothetical protein